MVTLNYEQQPTPPLKLFNITIIPTTTYFLSSTTRVLVLLKLTSTMMMTIRRRLLCLQSTLDQQQSSGTVGEVNCFLPEILIPWLNTKKKIVSYWMVVLVGGQMQGWDENISYVRYIDCCGHRTQLDPRPEWVGRDHGTTWAWDMSWHYYMIQLQWVQITEDWITFDGNVNILAVSWSIVLTMPVLCLDDHWFFIFGLIDNWYWVG